MHLIYIDDARDEVLCVFSALALRADQWRAALQQIRQFRHQLKRTDGIYVYKELHAWKFVSGRGQIASRVVPKGRRCQIFKDALQVVASLPTAQLFNAVFPVRQQLRAFERLLNRINRAMDEWGSWAILICDRGSEAEFTRLVRKMQVYNPIPSRYGRWSDTGTSIRNIPIDRIVEDSFFKDSQKSYFIQMVDFCAYALLRRERPLPSKARYGLDQAFQILSPILVRSASSKDPDGIIRP